jgi:hypothetical protein
MLTVAYKPFAQSVVMLNAILLSVTALKMKRLETHATNDRQNMMDQKEYKRVKWRW